MIRNCSGLLGDIFFYLADVLCGAASKSAVLPAINDVTAQLLKEVCNAL